MEINQKKIAQAMGISQMTVSLVLNNRDKNRVNPKLAGRIRNKARKMGYHPSVSAQILRTKPTDLGFLILQNYDEFRTNMEGHEAISNFVRECRGRSRKFQIEWFDQEHNPDVLPRMLTDGLVGGIICFGHSGKAVAERFRKSRIPIVRINEPGEFNVCFNMEEDVRRSVRELVGLGHTRLGIFNCSIYPLFTRARKGFLDALDELGLEEACLYETRPDGDFVKDILKFVDKMKKLPPDNCPTVLLADTAITAKTLVSTLQRNKIRVPEDVGVFSFCALDWEDSCFIPRLSGLEYTFGELIGNSVEMLLRLMNGEDLKEKNIVISQKISFRDSVRNLKNSN